MLCQGQTFFFSSSTVVWSFQVFHSFLFILAIVGFLLEKHSFFSLDLQNLHFKIFLIDFYVTEETIFLGFS